MGGDRAPRPGGNRRKQGPDAYVWEIRADGSQGLAAHVAHFAVGRVGGLLGSDTEALLPPPLPWSVLPNPLAPGSCPGLFLRVQP